MSLAKSRVVKSAALRRAPARVLQRKCDCGTHANGGACSKCQAENAKATLQRAAVSTAKVNEPPAIVQEALKEPGRPLDTAVRTFMESKFGHDFSGVRVHTDAKAAQSARAVNARAYTVGSDIVFAENQYQPGAAAGKELLAHELAHTIQQAGFQKASGDGLAIAPANDGLEREAEDAARVVSMGGSAVVLANTRPAVVQRAPWGACPEGKDRASARPKAVHFPAEEVIVRFYLSKAPTDRPIFSNQEAGKRKLKETNDRDPFINYVKDNFFTNPNPNVLSLKPKEEAALGERQNLSAREAATKEPDLLDFNNFFVYDVTSETALAGKKRQVANYVGILEDIRKEFIKAFITNKKVDPEISKWDLESKEWKPGKNFGPPQGKVFQYQLRTDPSITICYGPTDLDTNPGVILYRASQDAAAAPGKGESYEVIAAATTFTLQVDRGAKTDLTKLNDEATLNLVGGLHFHTLIRSKGKPDIIIAKYVQSRLGRPILEFPKDLQFEVGEDRRLKLIGKAPRGFHLEYLSEGTMTLDLTDRGLTGEGKLHSSLSLLKNAPFAVTIAGDQISASLEADPSKIKPVIPSLQITKADLGVQLSIQDIKAEGRLEFAIGPVKAPYVDGALKVSADANGLVATGKANAHVPGVSQAEGTLQYGNGELTGEVKIGAEQLKIPGVTGASLLLGVSNKKGVSFDGTVDLKLPTGQPAQLSVSKRGERFVYGGKATIDVPALKPVDFKVEYDGEHFTGEGKTGFTHLGMQGDLHVHYRSGEAGPEFTGDGKLQVKHGKANGEVTVQLHKNNKFSGKGEITYQLTENLIAGAGVELSEEGKLRVHGLLKFPKPIQIFQGFEGNKKLFHLSQQIPFPPLPVIVAEIGVGVGVSYGIGPGELRDVQIEAGFDPLEENKNLELSGGAKLVVPAHAGVYLSLDAGVGVGAALASATAGLNVRGDASLRGQLDAEIDLSYKQGRYVVDAEAGVHAGLTLKVSLGAFVQAHVGIGPFSAGTRKDWELASYSWGSGSQFGLTAPLHYASDEPFQAPSLDRIKFEKPDVDVKGLLAQLFQSAPSREQKT